MSVSTAKPCDVTPCLAQTDHFGRRVVEEMNISGEQPSLVADIATASQGLANLQKKKKQECKFIIDT